MKANKCVTMQHTSVANASATTKRAEKLIVKADQLEMYTKIHALLSRGYQTKKARI